MDYTPWDAPPYNDPPYDQPPYRRKQQKQTPLLIQNRPIWAIAHGLIGFILSFALDWLFGLVKIPDHPPILSVMLWMQQHAWIPILVGALILAGVLYLLQWRYFQIKSVIHWLTVKKRRIWALAGSAALVLVLALHPWTLLSHDNFVYRTPIPGPGCSSDENHWSKRTDITMGCTDHGLSITMAGGSIGEVAFDPQSLPGAENLRTYCIQTTVEFASDSADGFALIGVHGQNPGGQVIGFSRGGNLTIVRFTRTGMADAGPPLFSGNFQATSPYHLAVGVDGSHISVWVNKTREADISDPTFNTTAYVVLGLQSGASDDATVTFSNFVFYVGTIVGCGN